MQMFHARVQLQEHRLIEELMGFPTFEKFNLIIKFEFRGSSGFRIHDQKIY